MNKDRRTRLRAVLDQLDQLYSLQVDIRSALSSVYADELEALDNLPESLDISDRSCMMEDNLDALEGILADLDLDVQDIYSRIEDLICPEGGDQDEE